MTFASCIFAGKIPDKKDSLINCDSGDEIEEKEFLITLWVYCWDLWIFKFLVY